ncbi:hypothetical protein IJX73_00970 [bacterium]|nr:hypothetical protein [bacterium]
MTIYNYNGLEIDTEKLTIEDMPSETFAVIFELCGVEVATSILYNMCGAVIQVPARGFQKIEKKIILQDYDGTTSSIRAISRKLKISETLIRETLRKSKIPTPSEGQQDFTDVLFGKQGD